ncbi:MAG: ThuA domain-containing protein [Bacteroidota bacterium]
MVNLFRLSLLLCSLVLFMGCDKNGDTATPAMPRVLVFSKTEGYRHESIPAGIAMFEQHASDWKIAPMYSEDAAMFNADTLKRYEIIALLSTTGDFLTENQQDALKAFVQSGGNILGIHAAADAEYAWPWYGQMLGGVFSSHPAIQEAKCHVLMPAHASAVGLPAPWQRTDEWYNFTGLQADNKVVISLDESTYTGGNNGDPHPISWYREFDGGKIYYTGMGHAASSYSEPLFIKHIGGALEWLKQ